MTRRAAPLVVAGCGVAGLSVALAAAPRPVHLLGRGVAGRDSATALAQGGIAAAVGPGDTAAAHACDTLLAGAGLNEFAVVRRLVEQAPAMIDWLESLGLVFDRDDRRLRLGREGGHLCHRIAHAGGDASGAHLLAALTNAARSARHIDWHVPGELDGLMLHGDSMAGVRMRDPDGRQTLIEAADVVLATGGIGALYAATTNPVGADGNGLELALRAGAHARDLEFMQFHPTAIAHPTATASTDGALPLATEALRGAGARLIDDDGTFVMDGIHPLADLAPRDIVARRVWSLRQNGRGVWLDATAIGDDWPLRFPTVHAACLRLGIDPRAMPIPVTPAAHFHMGGIAVDSDGRTAVTGLHAVGEVACNRVHGANRLASNSLLEGLVFGRHLGLRLAQVPSPPRRASPVSPPRLVTLGPTADAAQLATLRELAWRALGPVRNGDVLRSALQQVTDNRALASRWQARLLARIISAALRRQRSLGAHFRDDSDAMPHWPTALRR